MNQSALKVFSVASLVLMASPILKASVAQADVSCRDYYQTYVDEATTPAPVVIVATHPHYHGHYPEYHARDYNNFRGDHGDQGGHDHGSHGDGNAAANDQAADIALFAIVAGLITTTAVQDAELNDSENVVSVIDQAQMGDGPELRTFLAKVQSDSKPGSVITLSQVADAVNSANYRLEFCPAGDLDSESELASLIATDLGVHK